MKTHSPAIAALLLAAAACGEALPDDSSTVEQGVVQVGVTYTLGTVHTAGKCLQVAGNENRAAVVLGTCAAGDTRQQVRFEDMGGGFYRIRNVSSNRCFDVENVNTATGARLVIWDCGTGANQRFRTTDFGGNVHQFIAQHSNLALDVNARGTADGTPIIQWTISSTATNQRFQLTALGGSTPPPAPTPTPTTPPPPPPPPSGDCVGSAPYDATVILSGSTWTVRRGNTTVVSTGDMREAIQRGVDSLSAGRTSKQRVLVQGSGNVAANSRISMPSFTTLNVCGTINVTGSGSGDMAPIYARGRTDIEIQRVNITGTPVYGMFFRDVENLTLGQIDLRVSSGLGIRVDNHGRADRSAKVRNLRIGNVFVQGTAAHGVETYGVDGVSIGTIVARNTGEAGLLFNDTVNATVGTVDADNAGAGTGYAAFRMANRNGRINNAYPTNIRVGTVIARRGGRGIFCVSESGGAVIDRVDIANTGNNPILIENCYNVTIAAVSGSVNASTGSREIRLANRTDFPVNSGVTIQNLTLTNALVRDSAPCGTNTTVRNNTLLSGSSISLTCPTAR